MLLPHWGLLHSLHLPKAPTRMDRSDARLYIIYIYIHTAACVHRPKVSSFVLLHGDMYYEHVFQTHYHTFECHFNPYFLDFNLQNDLLFHFLTAHMILLGIRQHGSAVYVGMVVVVCIP